MTDRELRLRQRIDQLTDERDHWHNRALRLAARFYRMRKSRDLWRLRATKR